MKVTRKSTKGVVECSNLFDATTHPPVEDGEVITTSEGVVLAAEHGHTGWRYTPEGTAEIARMCGGMLSPS